MEKSTFIGYINVDSFASQLWERKYPFLKDTPFLVADTTGKILAVSLGAAKIGVSLSYTLKEAESISPNINVIFKPEGSIEDKKISWEITEAIKTFCDVRKIPYQYFSPDECYLDLTKNIERQLSQNRDRQKSRDPFPPCFNDYENVYLEHDKQFDYRQIMLRLEYITRHLVSENQLYLEDSDAFTLSPGWDPRLDFAWTSMPVEDLYLLNVLFGASIMSRIVTELENCIGIRCSASVAPNMLLAKLACDFHRQGRTLTALTRSGMQRISHQIPVSSLPGIDDHCQLKLKDNFASNLWQLARVPLPALKFRFPHETAIKIYQSSRGICNTEINPNPILQNFTFSNYRLCITTNKELRTQLELLLRPMLKKLEEELLDHKRDTNYLKVTFSCCDVSGKENLVAEAEIHFCAQQRESLLFVAQRMYKEICKRRGFDSKFRTITSLEITHDKFYSILNDRGGNTNKFGPKYPNTGQTRYNESNWDTYNRKPRRFGIW